jgi:hypothetical protein
VLNKKAMLGYLEGQGLEEVDEIEYNDKIVVYNFFYSFDDAELEAAREYANENYEDAKGEDSWNEEFFLPYLTEMAADNIRDILEDMCAEFKTEGEFMVYELEQGRPEKCEFTIVLAEEGSEFDIEEIMDELDL